MTVAELIEKLKNHPLDTLVVVINPYSSIFAKIKL